MTEWAHYVVVSESGNRSPYEDGWAANWLDYDVLAGPDVVLPFIRSRTPGLSRDATWCEAAAVIDLHRKDLLFFTTVWGPAINRLRPAYWDLLVRAWPGWQVRWAYDATYPGAVGDLRDPILGVEPVAPADDRLSDPDSDLVLVTIEAGDCHLVDHVDHPAVEGPALLDRLKAAPDHATCGITVSGGVHVDPARRTMSWWTVGAHPVDVPALWPGWRVECWGDRAQEHVRASAGRFTPPRPDHHAGPRRSVAGGSRTLVHPPPTRTGGTGARGHGERSPRGRPPPSSRHTMTGISLPSRPTSTRHRRSHTLVASPSANAPSESVFRRVGSRSCVCCSPASPPPGTPTR